MQTVSQDEILADDELLREAIAHVFSEPILMMWIHPRAMQAARRLLENEDE